MAPNPYRPIASKTRINEHDVTLIGGGKHFYTLTIDGKMMDETWLSPAEAWACAVYLCCEVEEKNVQWTDPLVDPVVRDPYDQGPPPRPKITLWGERMKRLLGLLAVVLVVVACGGPPKPVIGTVTDKRFVAAHNETVTGVMYYRSQIMTSERCSSEMVGKSSEEQCSPYTYTQTMPVYGPVQQHDPDSWYLAVRDVKGKEHSVRVSQSIYNEEAIGASYDSRKA